MAVWLLWIAVAIADEDDSSWHWTPGPVRDEWDRRDYAYEKQRDEEIREEYDRDPPIRCYYEWISEDPGYRLETYDCRKGDDPWP